jgi:hypothetical protein
MSFGRDISSGAAKSAGRVLLAIFGIGLAIGLGVAGLLCLAYYVWQHLQWST